MKFAIVLLNWNGKNLLEQFLPSLSKFTTNAELYVIDNNSTDDSLVFLNKHYPKIHQVPLKKNYGFAKGYNEGLKQIKADVYCLLNNDVKVTENWLPPIQKAFETEEIAIAQPLILQLENQNHFEYAGAAGGFIDAFGFPYCRGRIFDSIEKNNMQYKSTEVFWASGACFFVRRNIWEQLNGFDEDFYMQQEEIDFCWRAKHQGASIQVVATSKVHHLGGASLSPSAKKTFLNHRNSLLMLLKNLPRNKLIPIIFVRMIFDGVAAFHYLFKGKLILFFMVLKAHLSVYFLANKNLKKRSNKSYAKNYYHRKSIVFLHFILRKCKFSDL